MSINISYEQLENLGTKNAFDIPVGTAFTGKIGEYTSRLFIRSYENIIALDRPKSCWTCDKPTNAPTVKNYQEVDLDIFVKAKDLTN